MRAAVIGTNWGSTHVAALREAGVDVVAVVGLDAGQARDAAGRWGVRVALDDVAALHALDLDLVTIATPAHTHADVLAAVPDVPVLSEKPAVGLSPIRRLPAGRRSPVWVNYAFAFLDVSRRAADHLYRLGAVTAAHVVSSYDMPDLTFASDEMFMELAPHPWSWLVRLFGVPRPASEGRGHEQAPGGVTVSVECGDVPVHLASVPEPGLAGLRHDVVIEGVEAVMTLAGAYRKGHGWRFEAPTVVSRAHLAHRTGAPSQAAEALGHAEVGPPDPWFRANSRSVATVVDAIRGKPVPHLLFPWDDALNIDRAAQAVIRARG